MAGCGPWVWDWDLIRCLLLCGRAYVWFLVIVWVHCIDIAWWLGVMLRVLYVYYLELTA